jgi:hypothetical protein
MTDDSPVHPRVILKDASAKSATAKKKGRGSGIRLLLTVFIGLKG